MGNPTEVEQKAALKEIAKKLKQAEDLIGECCVISRKNKVAFNVRLFGGVLQNEYFPPGATASEDFFDYDDDFIEPDYAGWQQSFC